MSGRYRVIVPVQAPGHAMPRSGLDPVTRRSLSLAFARDTLDVVRACPLVREVVVVSPDPDVTTLASTVGAQFVCSDVGSEMNDAIEHAHRLTACTSDHMVAALVSDIPALHVGELEEVLGAAARRKDTVHVTDLGGLNITLQAERADTFTACLGPDPSQRMKPRGTTVQGLLPGLRCDVDTLPGLRVATFMGVGPATSQAIDALGLLNKPRNSAV